MLTIYHNTRCSKSRQTLALIEESNTPVTIVEYLKTPLTADALRTLITKLGCTPIDIMRTKEKEFIALSLKDADENTLINAMVETPKLMERPIVETESKAIIGRPPENVLPLLSH